MFKKKIEFKKGLPGERILFVVFVVFAVLFALIRAGWSSFGLLLTLLLMVLHRLYCGKLKLHNSDFVLFWGLPGSGKTMFLTKTAVDNHKDWYIGVNEEFEHLKLKDFVYSRESLAQYSFSGAVVIFDEGSLNGFDNREFKTNFKDPGMLETFKKHRQMDMPFVFSNQGFEELDIKIRQSLSNKTYYCEDLGFFCRASLMIRCVSISEIDGQPQEGYRFPTLMERFIDPSVQLYAFKPYYGRFYSTHNPPCRVLLPALQHAKATRSVSRGR